MVFFFFPIDADVITSHSSGPDGGDCLKCAPGSFSAAGIILDKSTFSADPKWDTNGTSRATYMQHYMRQKLSPAQQKPHPLPAPLKRPLSVRPNNGSADIRIHADVGVTTRNEKARTWASSGLGGLTAASR